MNPIVEIDLEFINSAIAVAGQTINDLKPIWLLIVGLFLGIIVISAVIRIIRGN